MSLLDRALQRARLMGADVAPRFAAAEEAVASRRELLLRCGQGCGLLGLATLLNEQRLLAAPSPFAARIAHQQPRARRAIWIFVNGGPSQVDTWDYKPALERLDGQSVEGYDNTTGFFNNAVGGLMKSPFRFRQQGECGKWVSEIFPHLGQHVDKMAFIHSGFTESNNHSPALFMMNTGMRRMGFPCVGSWLTYGLGSETSDLPAFVVMSDPKGRGLPKGHALNWGAGFLPSVFQGTHFNPKGDPIRNLRPPAPLGGQPQEALLGLITQLSEWHRRRHEQERELSARIRSFELAYRMQATAPEAVDIRREPESLRRLYGVDRKECAHFARQCLVARRLLERGVRFVQLYSGGMENQRSWDGHNDIQGNHRQFAGETDQPVAALLADLEQRGMLQETLVIWGGEFGRGAVAQKSQKPGRDHNPNAFTTWFAGGGVRGGVSYGATDETGGVAVEHRVSVNDLHATILHLMGIDHERLTYRHQGRDFRLTDVAGRVVHEIVA